MTLRILLITLVYTSFSLGKRKKENIKMIKYSIALFLYLRLMFTENDKKPMTLTFNKHQSVEQFATDFFFLRLKYLGNGSSMYSFHR